MLRELVFASFVRWNTLAANLLRFVDDGSFKLLIVDSVMNLFSKYRDCRYSPFRFHLTQSAATGSDYSGRGELSERQQVRLSGQLPGLS
jgi:hypothetical protein